MIFIIPSNNHVAYIDVLLHKFLPNFCELDLQSLTFITQNFLIAFKGLCGRFIFKNVHNWCRMHVLQEYCHKQISLLFIKCSFFSFNCKNYPKLKFSYHLLATLALIIQCSICIRKLRWASAAPLFMHMHQRGVADVR